MQARLLEKLGPGKHHLDIVNVNDEEKLRMLLLEHVAETQSVRGHKIFADPDRTGFFIRVVPQEYAAALKKQGSWDNFIRGCVPLGSGGQNAKSA